MENNIIDDEYFKMANLLKKCSINSNMELELTLSKDDLKNNAELFNSLSFLFNKSFNELYEIVESFDEKTKNYFDKYSSNIFLEDSWNFPSILKESSILKSIPDEKISSLSVNFDFGKERNITLSETDTIDMLDTVNTLNNICNRQNLECKFYFTEHYRDYSIYFRTLNEIIDANKHLQSVAEKIKSFTKSPIERYALCFDYLSEYLNYDYEGLQNEDVFIHSPIRTLQSKKGVCDAFSRLLTSMLNHADIDSCMIVTSSKERGDHAVNLVYLKDNVYKEKGILLCDLTNYRLIDSNPLSEKNLNSIIFDDNLNPQIEVFENFLDRCYMNNFDNNEISLESCKLKKYKLMESDLIKSLDEINKKLQKSEKEDLFFYTIEKDIFSCKSSAEIEKLVKSSKKINHYLSGKTVTYSEIFNETTFIPSYDLERINCVLSQHLGIEISNYKVQNTSNINKKSSSDALNNLEELYAFNTTIYKTAHNFFDWFIKSYKRSKTSDDFDYLIEEIRILKEDNELAKTSFNSFSENYIIKDGCKKLYNIFAFAFKKGDSLKEYFKSSEFVSAKVEEVLNYELTFLYYEFKNFLNNSSLCFEFENFLNNYLSEDKESSHQNDDIYQK